MSKNYFEELAKVSVKDKVEKKGNFDYLSWANAWSLIKLKYPKAQRNVYEDPHTGLNFFTDGDFLPIIAPIGVGDEGRSYNINADLVAGKVAEAVQAEKLILMTNTQGVLDGDGALVSTATNRLIENLIYKGVISDGMLPKINSALSAIDNGVTRAHIIDGRVCHALLLEIFTNEGIGTLIQSE